MIALRFRGNIINCTLDSGETLKVCFPATCASWQWFCEVFSTLQASLVCLEKQVNLKSHLHILHQHLCALDVIKNI